MDHSTNANLQRFFQVSVKTFSPSLSQRSDGFYVLHDHSTSAPRSRVLTTPRELLGRSHPNTILSDLSQRNMECAFFRYLLCIELVHAPSLMNGCIVRRGLAEFAENFRGRDRFRASWSAGESDRGWRSRQRLTLTSKGGWMHSSHSTCSTPRRRRTLKAWSSWASAPESSPNPNSN